MTERAEVAEEMMLLVNQRHAAGMIIKDCTAMALSMEHIREENEPPIPFPRFGTIKAVDDEDRTWLLLFLGEGS